MYCSFFLFFWFCGSLSFLSLGYWLLLAVLIVFEYWLIGHSQLLFGVLVVPWGIGCSLGYRFLLECFCLVVLEFWWFLDLFLCCSFYHGVLFKNLLILRHLA